MMFDFGTQIQQCGHCGLWHNGTCQKIKAIEYHENGTVKRIEYHPDQPWLIPGTMLPQQPGAAS